MEYREYLNSPEWKIKRKFALERADYKCQVCNDDEGGLHVHHRTYENIFNEKLNDLTALCDKCHKIFHGVANGKKKKIHRFISFNLKDSIGEAVLIDEKQIQQIEVSFKGVNVYQELKYLAHINNKRPFLTHRDYFFQIVSSINKCQEMTQEESLL